MFVKCCYCNNCILPDDKYKSFTLVDGFIHDECYDKFTYKMKIMFEMNEEEFEKYMNGDEK